MSYLNPKSIIFSFTPQKHLQNVNIYYCCDLGSEGNTFPFSNSIFLSDISRQKTQSWSYVLGPRSSLMAIKQKEVVQVVTSGKLMEEETALEQYVNSEAQ